MTRNHAFVSLRFGGFLEACSRKAIYRSALRLHEYLPNDGGTIHFALCPLLAGSRCLFILAVAVGLYSLLTQGRVMDITVITLTMAALQIAVLALIADMIQKKGKL